MGWLGGLTKSSDRYAKWFGTRVPLVSRGMMILLTFLTAMPFSIMFYYTIHYTMVGIDFIIWFPLAIGFLVHLVILLILKIRFINPSTRSEFNALVSQIHQKIVIPSRARVWVRQSQDAYIATSFNYIFDAVIISEPMVDLIMKNPESGEALLAFHLLRVPRTRWIADMIGSGILFQAFTYASVFFLVPLAISIAQMISWNGSIFIIIYTLTSLAPLLLAPFLLIFLVKGTFWRHEPAFDAVQEIYGIHPNVAKVHIERGYPLNEEEAQTVVWSIREWEKRRRGARRLGVCTFVAIGSFFLSFIPLTMLLYSPFFPYLFFAGYLPFIVAGIAALIVYYVLKRWDKNAMGEVFKKTTDYVEPIWID